MYVATTFISIYTNCRSIEDARNIFNTMVVQDVVSWIVMIEECAGSGHI